VSKDVVVFGPADDRSLTQLQTCRTASGEDARGVLCADHHPGYSMPIGGVLGFEYKVMPAGVGFDIGCGNCAAQTSIRADDVDVASVMDEIARVLSFGVGRKNNERVDHEIIDRIAHAHVTPQRALLSLARDQLGTIGSGNHYVDLFRDESGWLWVGVHFGSRGFGHKTCTGFLAVAAGKTFQDRTSEGSMDSAPLYLDVRTPSGADYIEAMCLAGAYAHAGRAWVVDRVLRILGADAVDVVHNHHNYAWLEEHGGRQLWVIRKGATPAFPGQRGFVGWSMGEDAVIVTGLDSPQSQAALYSTVHGAGRVMSRSEAAGRVKVRRLWTCNNYRQCDGRLPIQTPQNADGSNPRCQKCQSKMRKSRITETKRQGKVDWGRVQADVKAKRIELRGGGADEAPEVYKRLTDVLGYHEGTIRIDHLLTPIGVAMAGANEFDPYKD